MIQVNKKDKMDEHVLKCMRSVALIVLCFAASVFLFRGCELTINYNGDPMASAGFEIPDDVTITWKDRYPYPKLN